MNMEVECAPPPFWDLEVGVVVRKRMKQRSMRTKNVEMYVCLFGLEML